MSDTPAHEFPPINHAAAARLSAPTRVPTAQQPQGVPPGSIVSMTALVECVVAPGVSMQFPVHLKAAPGGWRSRGKRSKWSPVCADVVGAVQAETALHMAEVETFRAPDGSIPTKWHTA